MATTLRELFEQRERQTLRPEAAHAADSRRASVPEQEHEYRTCFQRDRDRILHSKSFRRLKHKTQVFLAPEGDHYRTRLTHTLEASQISRTAARALLLNEDLTEAIALGHDLGHTPFGHAGESALNEVFAPGFQHAEQSLRVIDLLEEGRTGPGLNLTFEVRDGILNHSKGKSVLEGRRTDRAGTFEGLLVSVCDAIAYINHDIDDAVRAGLIKLRDLPRDAVKVLGPSTSKRIDSMLTGLIKGSHDGPIAFTPDILEATNILRSFMYENVYPSEAINREIRKAKKLLRELYQHLVTNPIDDIYPATKGDSPERRAVDMVAGMTDQYALRLYRQLFFPTAWGI